MFFPIQLNLDFNRNKKYIFKHSGANLVWGCDVKQVSQDALQDVRHLFLQKRERV